MSSGGWQANGRRANTLRRGTVFGLTGVANFVVHETVPHAINVFGLDGVWRRYEPGKTYTDAPAFDAHMIVSRGQGKRLTATMENN